MDRNVNIFETIELGQDYSVLNSRHTLCLSIYLCLSVLRFSCIEIVVSRSSSRLIFVNNSYPMTFHANYFAARFVIAIIPGTLD